MQPPALRVPNLQIIILLMTATMIELVAGYLSNHPLPLWPETISKKVEKSLIPPSILNSNFPEKTI